MSLRETVFFFNASMTQLQDSAWSLGIRLVTSMFTTQLGLYECPPRAAAVTENSKILETSQRVADLARFEYWLSLRKVSERRWVRNLLHIGFPGRDLNFGEPKPPIGYSPKSRQCGAAACARGIRREGGARYARGVGHGHAKHRHKALIRLCYLADGFFYARCTCMQSSA